VVPKTISEDEIKIESNPVQLQSAEFSGEVISDDEDKTELPPGAELNNIKRIINEYKELYKTKIEEQKQKVCLNLRVTTPSFRWSGGN
jgi:hypothetical protein